MALIAMATYCTPENCKGATPRNKLLDRVLQGIIDTVDFFHHRMIIVDNSPSDLAKKVYSKYPIISVINNNGTNLGTAEAINLAWKTRAVGENCIKMDDDCLINDKGWIDTMELAIRRMPEIGIIGLKRKDCWENPDHENEFYKSKLIQTPKTPAEKWITVEQVHHVMGTCQMYNFELLNKMGYLLQPDLYGFDDVWAALRSEHLGYINVFLMGVEIDHIDAGDTTYQRQKESHAARYMTAHHEYKRKLQNNETSVYYEPNWNNITKNKTL